MTQLVLSLFPGIAKGLAGSHARLREELAALRAQAAAATRLADAYLSYCDAPPRHRVEPELNATADAYRAARARSGSNG